MNKRFYVILIAFVMIFALAGCQEPDNSRNNGTPPENGGTSPANIQIDRATDEILSQYNSVHEYIHDNEGVDFIIQTDAEISDFAFISVDYVGEGDEFSFVAGEQLYQLSELSPDKPVVVRFQVAGAIPNYGITFVDTDDTEKYYTINFSGRGEDEAPPFFLLEFENTNSQ